MRTHAIYCKTIFRDAASGKIQTDWQTPSLHESCRSDGTWQDQQVRVRSIQYFAVTRFAADVLIRAVACRSKRSMTYLLIDLSACGRLEQMLGQFHVPYLDAHCTIQTTALPHSCKLCRTPMWPDLSVCLSGGYTLRKRWGG